MNKQTKIVMLKIFSMFSVVRGYNIPVIALAQYLAAIFIISPNRRALSIILDGNLLILVVSSSLTIATGYIINNFYDSKKDLINRPKKSQIDRLVSQATKLQVYFTVNIVVVLMAFLISFRAVLFFSFYIFFIWFYSHKLKKYAIIGNLTASFLAVFPFFAIFLYYKNLFPQIFVHALFLFLLLFIREIVKDLENLKGDIANNYSTIPVKYGELFAKRIILILVCSTIVPIYFLVDVYDVGYMDLYFYICLLVLFIFMIVVNKANDKKHYLLLHNILKIIIVSGVFSIVLINPKVLLHAEKLFGF